MTRYVNPDGSCAVRTEETWYAQGVGFVRRVKTAAYGVGGTIFSSDIKSYDLESYSIPQRVESTAWTSFRALKSDTAIATGDGFYRDPFLIITS